MDITALQKALNLQGYNCGVADGILGAKTNSACVKYAYEALVAPVPDVPRDNSRFPEKPSFPALSSSERVRLFGGFEWTPFPAEYPGQDVTVDSGWRLTNIVRVDIPQLKGIPLYSEGGKSSPTYMYWNKKAADQLRELWLAWEKDGLLKHILTYAGAYNPRYIRTSKKTLSNHAYGTAFDINDEWNRMGKTPALAGQKGCLYALVPRANEFGFYWGGHFSGSDIDGMHFEVAKIV